VWDAQTGQELFTFGHTDQVLHAAWSSDGTRIVTTGRDKTAKMWDADTGTELLTLSGHTGWVEHAAWNPDDTRIVTASADKTAKVWDAQISEELLTLSGQLGQSITWHEARMARASSPPTTMGAHASTLPRLTT
jgi:WD40 repeat protein